MTTHPSGPRLLTVPEAAQRLNVSIRKLGYLRQEGQLSAVKIGASVRYDPEELARFIRDHTTPRSNA